MSALRSDASGDARAVYTQGAAARGRDVAELERRSYAIGSVRLAIAVAIVALSVGLVWAHFPDALWSVVALLIAAFVALVLVHARIHRQKDRAGAARAFHERGLARLDGKWTAFASTGIRFDRDDHPYIDDLDIFGRASLFQLIDATETRFGQERLAGWLSGDAERAGDADVARDPANGGSHGPPSIEVLRARQDAVRELSSRVDFRERLSALGSLLSDEKPDPRPFLAWAEGAMPIPLATVLVPVARILPIITIGLALYAKALHLPSLAWVAPLLVQLIILGMVARNVSPIAGVVSSREGAFARYAEMLAVVEALDVQSPVLRDLKAKLSASGASATREMGRLRVILGFLDARQNEVWRLFIGPVLLWDLNCIVFLERWRVRVGGSVRAWFDALAEVEALASLAGFAFERPDHTFPEISDSPRFKAVSLGHPLISPASRVSNDVTLDGRGEALVVTGSNMSGKSTLLRAIGINAVLALAGAPVCAKSLVVGRMHVVTSMRVRDSLEEGVSRFYAEVRKLKRVIDRARSGDPTLFLLDEILHGTNSRERLIGARAIVRELLKCGATGAVSTHDLAIGDLEESLPGKVVNVHFEEQVSGDKMTFDYKLRMGVVQSSNALRIMRMVGIDVVDG